VSEPTTIALVQPGEMGAAVGEVLRELGHRVIYASEGRSDDTIRRAMRAGLLDVGQIAALAEAPVVLSICPPHAAFEVAKAFPGFTGTYIDANAISPAVAASIQSLIEGGGGTYVDGGIIGAPPTAPGLTTLYLSGPAAPEIAPSLTSEQLSVRVLGGAVTAASALKMAFASWTKGSSALILASRALARSYGVEDDLVAQWGANSADPTVVPELIARCRSAAGSAATKGWRWVAEMEEIARTYRDVGLPGDFHTGAAEVYRRTVFDRDAKADDETVSQVIDALVAEGHDQG
jgi:3-hydroxyisobutyrate dehydrogenase-like beta-hydroxyacid dehydrogenase